MPPEDKGPIGHYGEMIIKMHTDIKWMRQDAERRNGIMEEHVKSSDSFRFQVTRNTIWRHVSKVVAGGIFGILA